MANPLGRPRGKGPGKYTTSPKTEAANRAKAKLARPGRRADTPTEKLNAYKAEAIGRRLCLEVMEQVSQYLVANRGICTLLDKAIRAGDDPLQVAALAEQRMRPTELAVIAREVLDRWGQPRRTVADVAIRDMIPDFLLAGKETEDWHRAPEETHARPAADGHAVNGAAH